MFALSGLLIGVSSTTMALLMFVIAKQRLHYIWSAFCVSVAFWGFGAYMIATTADAARADFWWRVTHVGVIFIPVIFTHFVYEFLGRKNWTVVWISYALGALFLIANFMGDLFIANMRWVFDQFYYDSPPGILYIPFTFFFFYMVMYSHILLWQAIQRETGLRREQIQYFLGGMIVSFAGGSLSFLPVYQIDFYPIFNIAVFLYTPILTYAIVKTRLFDIRIILAHIVAGAIGFLLLVNVATARDSFEYLWKGSLFVVFLPAGYVLIRSVTKEIEARESIEVLARKLQRANKELARISRAKSDFLSIASHQLKTPLSIIKGYLSMTLEGSFGALAQEIRPQLQKVYISNERLISLVDDLLNFSRLEEGRMEYNFEDADIRPLITSVLEELKPQAARKSIALHWDENGPPLAVHADMAKIRNVFFNLIDNAIKYTDKGSVHIRLGRMDGHALIEVQDTGRGLRLADLSKLFQKFRRGTRPEDEWSRKVSVAGFGIGLYVARLILKAHNGSIQAASPGERKGSTFTVTLPLVEVEKSKESGISK